MARLRRGTCGGTAGGGEVGRSGLSSLSGLSGMVASRVVAEADGRANLGEASDGEALSSLPALIFQAADEVAAECHSLAASSERRIRTAAGCASSGALVSELWESAASA